MSSSVETKQAAVTAQDTCKIFRIPLSVGATEIEAQLLDHTGTPLCGAYFVCVRPDELCQQDPNAGSKP